MSIIQASIKPIETQRSENILLYTGMIEKPVKKIVHYEFMVFIELGDPSPLGMGENREIGRIKGYFSVETLPI
jgi:hypothetical protein